MLSNKKTSMLRVTIASRYADYIPEFYRNFQIHDSRINDTLKEEVPHWSPENPVLIDAPPGTGKTTFVYTSLIPTAMEAGKNVLLISNRIALSCQQKAKIMEVLDSPLRSLLTADGVREQEDFGVVRVITYHRLPALLDDPEAKLWLANLAFAVFDECHFFTADALFNSSCDYYLHLATTRFCRAVRVYLTATSWDVLVPLAEAEKRNFRTPLWELPVFSRTFYRYWLSASASHYHLHFFNGLDDLTPLIEAQPNEKWMVFVDKKTVGRRFCEALASKATYLDADSKGTSAWNELIQTETFPSQVLVTTAVLDCGVNIHDPTLKHIAVIADNRVGLIQMLGRKRLDPGEQVELWVCDLDQRVLSARANRFQTYLTWYDRLKHCATQEDRMNVAQDIWNADDPSLLKLFRLADGKLFPNQLAYWSIQRRLHVFRKILSGEVTFRETVASWLGMEPPPQQDQRAQLEAFYDTWGEKPLSSEQQNKLREIICDLYRTSGHKEPQHKRINHFGHNALSNRLREMELPFQVDQHGKAWMLRMVN